jgi:hypothetical protein
VDRTNVPNCDREGCQTLAQCGFLSHGPFRQGGEAVPVAPRRHGAGQDRWQGEQPVAFRAGDSNLFRYAFNSPTGSTDPYGEAAPPVKGVSLTYEPSKAQAGYFGAYYWAIKWKLGGIDNNFKGGVIIQRVSHDWKIRTTVDITIGNLTYKKGDTPVGPQGVNGLQPTTYYEAWIVDKNGKISDESTNAGLDMYRNRLTQDGIDLSDRTSLYHDFFVSPAVRPLNHKLRNITVGYHTVNGTAVFLEGYTAADLTNAGFTKGKVKEAGKLLAVYDKGETTLNRFKTVFKKCDTGNPLDEGMQKIVRKLTVTWDANKDKGKGTVDIQPNTPPRN